MTTGKETESYGTNFMPAIQGTNFNTIKSQTRVILDVHMNIELASDGLWKVLWAKVGRDGHWAKSNLKKKLIWMPKSTNNPKPISSSKPNTTQTQNKPLPQPSYTKPTSNKPNSSQFLLLRPPLSLTSNPKPQTQPRYIQNNKHIQLFSQPSSPRNHKHNLDSTILRFFIPSQTFSKSIHA